MRIPRGRRPFPPDPGRSFPRARSRRVPFAVALVLAFLAVVPGRAVADDSAATRRRLNGVATRISRIQSALAVTRSRIDALNRSVARAETQLKAARRGLVALSQGLYMGTLGEATALMTASSLNDFGDRIAFVDHLQSVDRDVLQRVAVARRHAERQRKALSSVLARQKSLLRSFDREQAALARLFREQQARLAALERSRRNRARAARFDPPIGGRGPFRVCPVDRPRAYSNDFGAPRGDHRHQGNDILAPRGTPIRAPFDGRVKRSRSRPGGNQAYVYGASGYVFNAHLDSYSSASGYVSAGTIIGYVGNTGNARGGPYHDHFEWHPGNGRAVSPYRYLNLVC